MTTQKETRKLLVPCSAKAMAPEGFELVVNGTVVTSTASVVAGDVLTIRQKAAGGGDVPRVLKLIELGFLERLVLEFETDSGRNFRMMANQFNAKVRFEPVAWRAYDRGTQSSCLVTTGIRYNWTVKYPGGRRDGSSATASGARASCRRVIANLGKRP